MSDRMKKSFDININTNVDTEPIKAAEKELNGFFDKYENKSLELGINKKSLKIDTKDFYKAITATKELDKSIGSVRRSAPMMIKALNADIEFADNVKSEFSEVTAVFNDNSVVHGIDNVISKMQEGFTVVAVDLGERVQYLKQQIADTVGELKNISAIETNWNGRVWGFSGDDMSESQLEKRIELLKELLQNQQELEVFNGSKFDQDNAPAKMASNGLNYNIGLLEKQLQQMRDYNSQVEEQYKLTTKQFKRRQALIDSTKEKSWDEDYQSEALKKIDDEDEYDRAISNLKYYIESRRNLIDELRASENELFRADGIDHYIENVEAQINEYENNIKELENAKKGKQDVPIIGGNLSEVVDQLKEIKDAINAIKVAFEPLTNALSAEDSALHKMITTSIDDLNTLESRLKEVYQMIDVISKKQFNTTNVISNGNASSAQADLDLIRQLRKEARDTYKQVEQLHIEALGETGSALVKSGHTGSVLKFQEMMSDFDLVDLSKRTKSRSAASLAVVLDELKEWKAILLQFNELRNKVTPGSFDASKYPEMQAKPVNENITSISDEVVDDSVVESNDILDKVKTLSEQIEAELTSIRAKMEEAFDLSTVDPKIESVKTITDAIYQQFVELQAKINALDLNLEIPAIVAKTDDTNKEDFTRKNENVGDVSVDTSKDVEGAAESIKQEGNEAEIAAQKKREFIEANKKVAKSGSETKAGIKEATDAIEEEGEAAEDSAKRIAMAQQAVSSFNEANKTNVGDTVRLKGLTQADFENYANEVAKSKGLKVGDISVSIGENGNMMVASVQMLNEELAQSITYTYKLMELEEGVTEAYLTGYRAKGNQNKALKIAAAEQKKADAARLKADKEKAKNNEWLIKQQSKLDTQERKYKHSNKSIDGSTALMSTETSLEGVVDDADKTIDTLAKHIRDRIQSAVGGTLTDDLKEQILNDIRILQNEIAVAQSNKYSATNMKASNVETNKKAYKEYLNAFEANAKKANVFKQMEQDIVDLRAELDLVNDSAGLDAFIDKLKIARNKLTAEKAKYAQEAQESKQNEQAYNHAVKAQEKLYNLKKKMVGLDPQSVKGQETMRKLTEAQKEYNDVIAHTHNLTSQQRMDIKSLEVQQESELNTLRQEYKSNVSAEQEAKDLEYVLSLYKKYTDAALALKKIQSDTTGAVHTEKEAAAIEDVQSAKADLLSLGIDVNNISESELLTEKQKNAMLEEQVKYKKQIRDIENTSSDKAATKENKQNQNYGKTIYNREQRYFESIGAKERSLDSDAGLSGDFLAKLEKYKAAFKELQDLRDQFAKNPDAFNNEALKGKFQETALEVEGLRKEILSTFKEAEKFDKLSASGSLLGKIDIDSEKFKDAKSAMIDFAASITDGQFKFEGFNAAGTEMYGTLSKGEGVVEKVTVALRAGTNQLYAYKAGTKQVSSSWDTLGSSLKSGVKQLVGMYFGVHEAIQAVRKGLTYVKEIDLALTELKKVTDETDATYRRFLKDASATSTVIGSTISDFTDATAAFARLGYSIDESSKMAETAIVYKNVADGLDTVEESTESIISTMKAYGIEANDTMGIIDRFNAVGKLYCPGCIVIYNQGR